MDDTWIPTANRCRVLMDGPAHPRGVLLALHGYGQLADAMVEALSGVIEAAGWALCCPEGPHRFYPRRTRGAVGASWMSAHGRAHDIAGNRAYLAEVLAQLAARWPGVAIAGLGFSQGASQLWRLAHDGAALHQLISVGGDIPPELHAQAPATMPPALVLRGERDPIYGADRLAADGEVLAAVGWPHRIVGYVGGHEISDAARDLIRQALAAEAPS